MTCRRFNCVQARPVYQYMKLLLYQYSSIDVRYNVSCLQRVIPHFDTLLWITLKETFQNMTTFSNILAGKHVSDMMMYKNAIKHSKMFRFFIYLGVCIFSTGCICFRKNVKCCVYSIEISWLIHCVSIKYIADTYRIVYTQWYTGLLLI